MHNPRENGIRNFFGISLIYLSGDDPENRIDWEEQPGEHRAVTATGGREVAVRRAADKSRGKLSTMLRRFGQSVNIAVRFEYRFVEGATFTPHYSSCCCSNCAICR
jgi:hypothetical protein